MNPPCAGIIVFSEGKTVLVATSYGNHSFPKGKRHRNETHLECAWRELQEETGLTKDNVTLIDDNFYLDERTAKGNLSVRYFVGMLTTKINKFTFDPKELENVSWFTIDEALHIEKFKSERKEILKLAFDKFNEIQNKPNVIQELPIVYNAEYLDSEKIIAGRYNVPFTNFKNMTFTNEDFTFDAAIPKPDKILVLNNELNFDIFTNKYAYIIKSEKEDSNQGFLYIDWRLVREDFKGLVINDDGNLLENRVIAADSLFATRFFKAPYRGCYCISWWDLEYHGERYFG